MTRLPRTLILGAAMLAACARPTPEQQLVNDIAAALGGAARIRAVKTLVIEGRGTQYNLGQDLSPGATSQTFEVTQYRRAVDLIGGRARTELTRVPKFTYWQGLAPQRQIQALDGAIAYNVGVNGSATRAAQAVTDDRRAEFLRHPITAVRAALDPAAHLENVRVERDQTSVEVHTPDGREFTLTVDSSTKLPTRVATPGTHINLGDITITTAFAGYQPVDGLQLPSVLKTAIDGVVTSEVRATAQRIDADPGNIAAPAEVAAAPVPVPQPAVVTVEEAAPGVWLLAGGSHNSALVEFRDRLILIDAPQNDARTQAVIAKARALRPGKPLTHVVNSHHHFDHSGGIRAAVAEGLTVITHEGNAGFIEDIVKRPHTRAPDALARHPQSLTLETVSGEKVISDGTMTMHLYAVPSEHSQTMLMAYFPRERGLVVIDLYEPGEKIHMFAAPFVEELKRRRLRVDEIWPLHGKIVPYAQLLKDASS